MIKQGAGKVPGLLAVLALVPDPRRLRGRRYPLAFVLAVAGKWLRGVADGQVKLFAAMLHEEKVMIAQHRIPDQTTETTQVKALLEAVDLRGAVVTADAAHSQRETAEYIAGPAGEGGRESDYFLFVIISSLN